MTSSPNSSPVAWEYALRVRELYGRTAQEAVAIVEFGARIGLSYSDALRFVSLAGGHPVVPAMFLFAFAQTQNPGVAFTTGILGLEMPGQEFSAWARAQDKDGSLRSDVTISTGAARSLGYAEFGRFQDELPLLLTDLAMARVARALCPIALYGWLTPDEADLRGRPVSILGASSPQPPILVETLPATPVALRPRALRVVESAPPPAAPASTQAEDVPPDEGARNAQELDFEDKIRSAVEMPELMGVAPQIAAAYAKDAPEAERLRALYRKAKERIESRVAAARVAAAVPTRLPSEAEYDRWLRGIQEAKTEAEITSALVYFESLALPADNPDAAWVRRTATERRAELQAEDARLRAAEVVDGEGLLVSEDVPPSVDTLPGIGSDAHHSALVARMVPDCSDPKGLYRDIVDAALSGRIVTEQFRVLVMEFESMFPALVEWVRKSSPRQGGYPKRSQAKTAEYPPMTAPARRVVVPEGFDPSTLPVRLRGLWQHAANQFPHQVGAMRQWMYRVSVATTEDDATTVMADAELQGVSAEIKTLLPKWFEAQRAKFFP